jgi:hypothetical protein
MESMKRGLGEDYLDTLLPAEWDVMDIYERRNFLNGSEFGGLEHKGTVKRTSVSNMEIGANASAKSAPT